MRQIRLQDVCEQIVDDVDGALGCALIDLTTGLPLALDVKPASVLSAASMELMSAAGVTYFGEAATGQPVQRSSGDLGGRVDDRIQEIQTTTEDAYLFMSRLPGEERELLILIMERGASNLGLGWMAMRRALDVVQQANGNGTAGHSDTQDVSSQSTLENPHPDVEPMNPRARGRRTIWGQR